MTFEVFSPQEVRWRYQQAKDKKAMFYVLADLTVSQPSELAEFLGVKAPDKRPKDWTVGKQFDRKKIVRPDREQIRELWSRGLNDRQIADEIDCVPSTVARLRKEMGLETNVKKPVFPAEEARRLHAEGKNDVQIAHALGINVRTVAGWRHRHGLATNYDPHFQTGRVRA